MAIMSALVWYIVPGLLGRAYDLKNETVGPDLFDFSATKAGRIIPRYSTTSEYKLVSDLSEATDFLDVSGQLALKIKTGAVNIEGTGNYLKESSSFQSKIDLLIKVHYETETVILPSDVKPLKNWQSSVEGSGNTHYIRSITYGGDLVASISFVTNNEADREIIRGEIQGELNSKSGSYGGGLKGNLEKIQNKTKNSASMSINYYATVPLENVPSTIDGLTNLVEKFPEQTKKVNKGRGVPLKMEVFSLENLDKDFETYTQTRAYTDMLSVLNEQLTDFRNARKRLGDWLKTVPPVLPDAQNHKIGEFSTKLDELNYIYSKVIGNLDMSDSSTPDQFKVAFDAYKRDSGYTYPDLYVRELSKLKAAVLEETPALEADFGGGHYSYWGFNKCPNKAVLVFDGVMSATNRNTIGSATFSCIPNDRQYYPDQEEEDEEDIHSNPQFQPIVFISRKRGSNGEAQTVKCANCRLPGKSSVTVLSGETSCPKDFTKEYEGVLVTTEHQSVRGELVCLDTSKEFSKASHPEEATQVTEASPKCGDFPCSGGVSEDKAIPCVVCSIKKETKSIADVVRL